MPSHSQDPRGLSEVFLSYCFRGKLSREDESDKNFTSRTRTDSQIDRWTENVPGHKSSNLSTCRL